MSVDRRGFTLVEALFGLVLTGLVVALVYDVLTAQQRGTERLIQGAALAATLRSAAGLLGAELGDAAPAAVEGDLLGVAAESVTYRAMRGTGLACGVSGTAVDVVADWYSSYRQPQAGRDSLLLLVGADPARGRNLDWLSAPISGVGSSLCGSVGALRLSTTIDTGLVDPRSIALPAPVRVFEVMQLKLYQSQGLHWLGARSVSAGEVIQPALGPFTAAGLRLDFLDTLGAATLSPTSVRSGRVFLRAISSGAVHSPVGVAHLLDSTVLALPLRNAEP